MIRGYNAEDAMLPSPACGRGVGGEGNGQVVALSFEVPLSIPDLSRYLEFLDG